MRKLLFSFHAMARWLLLVALLLAALPSATRAQEQAPTAAPADTDPASAPVGVPFDSFPVDPPAAVTPPLQTAAVAVQGDIQVDVTTSTTIHAGDIFEYTYIYTNTKATAAELTIQTVWDNFSTTVNGNTQFCTASADAGASCAPVSVVGPAVTKAASCVGLPSTAGLCYSIASLAGNQSGRFNIRIGTKSDTYPKSGQALRRPAGSARLFIKGTTTLISEDTASTLIVGPVLTVTKTSTDSSKKIYPTQTATPPDSEIAEFTIKVGNATASGDKPSGVLRSDAINATNIIITDTFPLGSALVSATGNPIIGTTPISTATWIIPGPLAPGAALPDIKIKYRKLDVNKDCGNLNNSTYTVTSNEYPLSTANKRYAVPGTAAKITVVTPMVIKSITADPATVTFGSTSTIKIVIQSFWTQPLNGVTLSYTLQSNASYVGGSASPAPTTTSDTVVTWKVDMPAATSRTTAQEKTFILQVLGTNSNAGSQSGRAALTVPAGVPSACIKTVDGRVNLNSRLRVTKTTDADKSTIALGGYTVEKGSQFKYILELENTSDTPIDDIDLTDSLPSNNSANLSYVNGSATLNGSPREPDAVVNGSKGLLTFNDLSLPAKGKATITYMLTIGGLDYFNYCNGISATIGGSTDETVTYPQKTVCVRVNPRIKLTKTINGGTTTLNVKPGDTVTFQLTITNNESTPYIVGLFDSLGSFEYIKTTAGYDMNPDIIATPYKGLRWKLQTLAPNESRSVTLTAKVPDACVTKNYINEAMFHNDEGTVVRQVPGVKVTAHTNCGKIEYESGAAPVSLSLQDRFTYNLIVRNTDANTVSSVPVTNVLPLGFTYVTMDPSSAIKDAPTTKSRTDGRVELHWELKNIKGNSTNTIKVITRTGLVVGKQNNQFTAEGGDCKGKCDVDKNDNNSVFSTIELNVSPLITVEPKLSSTACTNTGDTRTYQLAIVNTNTNHGYNNTTVTAILPLGLTYVNAISETVAPIITTLNTGGTQLSWSNLTIPAKPSNSSFSQKTLMVNLKVGNVLGNLSVTAQANSVDGAIPRKEGVVDPTISVCALNPGIAKVANAIVNPKGEIVYDIIVANPKPTDITATIEDQLPDGLKYSGVVSATGNIEPTVSNNGTKLTWTDVTIPSAGSNPFSEVHLRFKVTVASDKVGQQYKNTATVVKSSQTLDVSRASYTVTIAQPTRSVYLPLIRRK